MPTLDLEPITEELIPEEDVEIVYMPGEGILSEHHTAHTVQTWEIIEINGVKCPVSVHDVVPLLKKIGEEREWERENETLFGSERPGPIFHYGSGGPEVRIDKSVLDRISDLMDKYL